MGKIPWRRERGVKLCGWIYRTPGRLYALKACLGSGVKFFFLERGYFHSQMNLGARVKIGCFPYPPTYRGVRAVENPKVEGGRSAVLLLIKLFVFLVFVGALRSSGPCCEWSSPHPGWKLWTQPCLTERWESQGTRPGVRGPVLYRAPSTASPAPSAAAALCGLTACTPLTPDTQESSLCSLDRCSHRSARSAQLPYL